MPPDRANVARAETLPSWGGRFRITGVPSGMSGARHGAWQGICKYHQLFRCQRSPQTAGARSTHSGR
eukprot:14653490-Alexandrium_andersonii.AAC.1